MISTPACLDCGIGSDGALLEADAEGEIHRGGECQSWLRDLG
jgi:hypothetical protein